MNATLTKATAEADADRLQDIAERVGRAFGLPLDVVLEDVAEITGRFEVYAMGDHALRPGPMTADELELALVFADELMEAAKDHAAAIDEERW